MKTIITTVGTSIFTNCIKRQGGDSAIKPLFESIEDKEGVESYHLEDIKNVINDILKRGKPEKGLRSLVWDNIKNLLEEEISAETKSIHKIINGNKANFTVHLIATDTVLSILAAEIICTWLNTKGYTALFCIPIKLEKQIRDSLYVIKNLRIKNNEDYQDGFLNLVEVVDKLIDGHGKDNVILNITGGYKAIIPIMTLVGQLKEVPLNYIYEDSDKLVEVGNLPINFDWVAVEKFYILLQDFFGKGGMDWTNSIVRTEIKDIDVENWLLEAKNWNLISIKGNTYSITHIGIMFKEIVRKEYIGKNSLGFFVEYKILEYYTFYDEVYRYDYTATLGVVINDQIEKQKEENKTKGIIDGSLRGNEVDMLLEKMNEKSVFYNIKKTGKNEKNIPSNTGFIPVEIKPLYSEDKEQFKLWCEKIKDNWGHPMEIQLIVYSFLNTNYLKKKISEKNFIENKRVFYNTVKTIFSDAPKVPVFKLRVVNFPQGLGGDSLKKMMEKPLHESFFIKDFDNSDFMQS